jgi:hypothetical protein
MEKNKLRKGNVYFSCSWLSLAYPVPEIESYIYDGVGEESAIDGEIYHLFIDPEWYYLDTIVGELTEEQKTSYTKPPGPKLIRVKESELSDLIYDLDELKSFVKELGGEPNANTIYS